MKRLYCSVAILCAMGLCSASFAEEQNVKSINFEEDRIEGDLLQAGMEGITVKPGEDLSDLVKARDDFSNELRKSADMM